MGKESKQKVVWDKFPLYCKECLHVGHASETCYAAGKRPMPARWVGTGSRERTFQPQKGGTDMGRDTGKEDGKVEKPRKKEDTGTGFGAGSTTRVEKNQLDREGNSKGRAFGQKGGKVDKLGLREEQLKNSALSKGKDKMVEVSGRYVDDDGFQKQGRKRNNVRGNAKSGYLGFKSGYLENSQSDGEGVKKDNGKVWKEKGGSSSREFPGSLSDFKKQIREGTLANKSLWSKGMEYEDMSDEELEMMYEGMFGYK